MLELKESGFFCGNERIPPVSYFKEKYHSASKNP
jgi:hypothetical protein